MSFKKLLATGITAIILTSAVYLPVSAENFEDLSYDNSTNGVHSEIEDLIYSIGIGGIGGDVEVNGHLTSFSTTINGKAIPLAEYGIGATAMQSYGGATSCAAFSRYVFDQIWGYSTPGLHGTPISLNSSFAGKTGQQIKDQIKAIPLGSNIKMNYTSTMDHWMVLVKVTEEKATFYHSYWQAGGIVSVTEWTWADLQAVFIGIYTYYKY